MAPMAWDLFCRVVDHHGDVGVCWRLAADLASRGHSVRLWIDDASALAWMAPAGAPGVAVRRWSTAGDAGSAEVSPASTAEDVGGAEVLLASTADGAGPPGDVVVEAFGCTLADAFVARMAARPRPCVWIDLEYLTAEGHAARSHGLASPQAHGPGVGLTKRFFFPGFVTETGGLLREPGLLAAREAFDRTAWLAAHGIAVGPDERVVSLFCYAQPAVPALLDALVAQPTVLLTTPGPATRQVTECLGPTLRRGELRAIALPFLTHPEFDHLLWSSDLNFVRGEDSFVRAQWAGAPFVWQAYRQDDGAHGPKLRAFLDQHLAGATGALRRGLEPLWAAWNGDVALRSIDLPPLRPWAEHCVRWRDRLATQPDLATQLLKFVRRNG